MQPIDDNTNNDESFDKPGYDGRLQYYKIIGGFMKGISESSLSNNYDAWFNLIHCMFDMVCPFIRKPDELKKEIEKVEKIVYSNSSTSTNHSNQYILNRNVEKKLHELTGKLYTAAKHMLLPIQEETDTEYSTEEFFRGSDL